MPSPFPVDAAVALIVPLCLEVAELHAQGYGLLVHPSNVVRAADGTFSLASELAALTPTLPKDAACLPPETPPGELNDARGNVYAIGAMLYEMTTGLSVGPGMRRPRDVNPNLPPGLETILATALIRDPAHRPADLLALAHAIHSLAAPGTVAPPPPIDPVRARAATEIDIDVSLSMLPPAPASQPRSSANGYGVAVVAQPAGPAPTDDATATLAQLKARLESDPRPRYVVVKDGMDHGPFTAVELLQQIGANTFIETDVLRDEVQAQERTIALWEEFAPFAEHARRHRDIADEKAAVVRVAKAESKSTRGKALLGAAVLLMFVAGGISWYMVQRGTRKDEVAAQAETVSNIETDGAVKSGKKRYSGGGGVVGSKGGIPQLGGGMSCEGAIAAYKGDEMVMGKKGQADLTANQFGRVLNGGGYFSHCGVPFSMSVHICAAVQNGRAVGVTVSTSPKSGKAACVANAVRRLSFPSHPKLDITRTTFAAQ